MELNRVIIKNNIILNKYIGIERNGQKDMTNIISEVFISVQIEEKPILKYPIKSF